MKEARALAMFLFDTYAEMRDEDQARALATLQTADPAVHDALVHLLVTDALDHDLDLPPWLCVAAPPPAGDDLTREAPVLPDDTHR